MITVRKGNAENIDTFRLLLICDQCKAHIKMDVPLHNIRDQGEGTTEFYLERARGELARICPHMQEELRKQAIAAQPSLQEGRHTPQRRFSSYDDYS